MNSFDDLLNGWNDAVPSTGTPVAVEMPWQIDSSDIAEPPAAELDSAGVPESGGDEGEPIGNYIELPADTTSGAAPDNMRARYSGHAALNDLARADWVKAIKLSPDAFDALLYRAVAHVPDKEDLDHTERAADNYDPNQVLLDYLPPEMVMLLDCPDEMDSFAAMYDDSDNTGAGMDALILRTTGMNVPVGSVFEWHEELTEGRHRRCWWYVQRIFNYGTAKVGSLFYCIPFRSPEAMNVAE